PSLFCVKAVGKPGYVFFNPVRTSAHPPMVNHWRKHIDELPKRIIVEPQISAPCAVELIICPGTMINTKQGSGPLLVQDQFKVPYPPFDNGAPPVPPFRVMVGQDPGCPVRSIPVGNFYARSRLKSDKTVVAKAGFRKHRVRFFKLGV